MCENSHETEILDKLESTIHHIVHSYQGGARALAKKIGLRPGTFNNKCDPKMNSHVLNVRELVNVINETGDYRILFELAHQFGYACLPIGKLDGVSDIELLNAWAEWDSERGQTAQTIKDALNDNNIGDGELTRIRNEMLEDIQKELELLKRLESIYSK